jgi:hypothetical protein
VILGILSQREYGPLELLKAVERDSQISPTEIEDAIWRLLHDNQIELSPRRTFRILKRAGA